MPERSFQQKLITGVIVICLLGIVASSASLFVSQAVIANTAQVASGVNQDLADARSLQLLGTREIADVRASLLAGGTRFDPQASEESSRVRDLATRLRARIPNPEGRALLDDVLAAERDQQRAFADARVSHGSAPEWSAVQALALGMPFDRALAAYVTHVESSSLDDLARTRAALNRAEVLLIVIAVSTIVLLVSMCFLLIAVLNQVYQRQLTARTMAERGQSQARATLSEVETASNLKDEFLATVSHELRNPLAPLLTWTQLLRSGTLNEEKSRLALEVIENSVVSQVQLIDDLVDVSRVAAGKFRLDVRPIDLATVIRTAAEAQRPASDAKQIRLQLVLDERAGLISGDSERLQQVMWNLISNAIKFTPKGGKVQVVLQKAESHLEIKVHDTGMGIDSDFLPHVFEPFRQAVSGSMRRHGGLGLGLSIVRHIVELHGGEITAHSEGANLGSEFIVKFPMLATASENGGPEHRHPVARDALPDVLLGRLDGIRVLVVDDEPSTSEALQELFTSCGAEARTSASASAALETFDVWQPNVLVSDIAMPGQDGYSLIRSIRLRSPKQGGLIPAVALTAYAKIEDRVTILGAGFQMYLSKPADPSELVAVVRSLARGNGARATPR